MKRRIVSLLGVIAVLALAAAIAVYWRRAEPPAVQAPRTDREVPSATPIRAATNKQAKPETPSPAPHTTLPTIARPNVGTIPATLRAVMGQGENDNYFTRIKAVHALGKKLSSEEITCLYVLLYRKAGEDKLPLDQEEWGHPLKHVERQ